MFRSHITRPLIWAIPLAVVAGIVAAVWYLRPLEIDIDGIAVSCRDAVFLGDSFGNPCSDLRRERFLTSGLILLVGGLPLVLVVLRACVLAVDTLVSVQQDVQRLHDRLDRERSS